MLLWQNVVAKIDGPFVHGGEILCRTRLRRRVAAWIAAAWSSIWPARGRTDRVVPRVVRDASVLRRALFPKKWNIVPAAVPAPPRREQVAAL